MRIEIASPLAVFTCSLVLCVAVSCTDTARPVDPALTATLEAKRAEVERQPSNTNAVIELAELYQKAGRKFDAADTFLAALDRGSRDARVYAGLAATYFSLGYFEACLERLRECLSIDRDQASCLLTLARVMETDSRPEAMREARRAYERFLSVAPNHAEAEEAKLAIVRLDTKLESTPPSAANDDANVAHDHASSGKDTAPHAHADDGSPHGEMPAGHPNVGAPAAAMPAGHPDTNSPHGTMGATGDGALHAPPPGVPGHGSASGSGSAVRVGGLTPFGAAIGKAYAARRKGDTIAAEAAYREALSLNPTDPSALTGLAEMMWTGAKKAEAFDIAAKVFAAHPEDSEVRWVFGLVAVESGRDRTRGLEAWKSLVRDDPEVARELGLPARIASAEKPAAAK